MTQQLVQGTVPTEFLYWDKVDTKAVQRARRAWQKVWRFDPQPSDELVDRFARAYYDTDPVAEQFVADVYDTLGMRTGRTMLDQAIEHGIDSVPDAPESMKRLFAEFETPPDWIDWDLVHQGAKVFRRYGTDVFAFATASTLEMYTESSIAKPLALAGGYTGSRARHRQLETIKFWIDVSDPGGLEPGADGRGTAMRVRIMHVFIRRRLVEHPEWDAEAWGAPISVGDATLTLMGGSVVPGLALWSVGHQTTIKEIEALMHFWRYVGHLLGVQLDWFPRDFQESVQLMFAAFVKRAYAAGDDGRELIESYLPAFAPRKDAGLWQRVRDERAYRTLIGYTRFWMLPKTYLSHDMPRGWWLMLLPLLQAPVVLVLETVRRTVPAVDLLADRTQRRRRDAWYAHHMGDTVAEFKPPEEFRR